MHYFLSIQQKSRVSFEKDEKQGIRKRVSDIEHERRETENLWKVQEGVV